MIVGIDPGHGGYDPGAISPVRLHIGDQLYTKEAEMTLDIAERVQGILLACGYQVIMTRIRDEYVSLNDRSNLLNRANCDIAVSIHLNSSNSATANYIATYIQTTGGKAEQLAASIQKSLVKATGWPDGGVKVQNLHMTRETKMPAVLTELGFVSNPYEEQQINLPVVQSVLAAAIAEGILSYFGPVEPWQKNLFNYAVDAKAGKAEIARAGEVWKARTAAGNFAGADAAHKWANQVRQAMGLPITQD